MGAEANEPTGLDGCCSCCVDRYWFIYWLGSLVSKAFPIRAQAEFRELNEGRNQRATRRGEHNS